VSVSFCVSCDFSSSWPDVEEKKIDESFETAEKSLEKTVADILNVLKIIKEKQGLEGKKVYLYTMREPEL
jgi:hypothetical protein